MLFLEERPILVRFGLIVWDLWPVAGNRQRGRERERERKKPKKKNKELSQIFIKIPMDYTWLLFFHHDDAQGLLAEMPEFKNSFTFGALCTALSTAGKWHWVFRLLEDMLESD